MLGGTFNPPHLGHLALARHAREQLGLEGVVLMPAHTSPFKMGVADPGPEHRLEMCRLLVEGSPGLSAWADEIERGGISYTVDTLTAIGASHPDARLTLVVGADTAATVPQWHEPARLLELAGLAVASRAGSARSEVLEALQKVSATASARARFVEMGVIDISSSIVRSRSAAGEPIEELVGVEVARYIAEHGLYRDGGDAAA